MDLDAARDFLRENHRGVLAKRRSNGERERRVLLRITLERAGPDRQG